MIGADLCMAGVGATGDVDTAGVALAASVAPALIAVFLPGSCGRVGKAGLERAGCMAGCTGATAVALALAGCQEISAPPVHCRRTCLSVEFAAGGDCPAQLLVQMIDHAQRAAAIGHG